jgi:hypothetical protein
VTTKTTPKSSKTTTKSPTTTSKVAKTSIITTTRIATTTKAATKIVTTTTKSQGSTKTTKTTTSTTTTTSTISTTIITTTTVKLSCFNYNNLVCSWYASIGYCSQNVYVNGELITISCAATCNPSCRVKTTTEIYRCSDYNPTLCPYYSSVGYCFLNAIKESCPVSCNSCP